MENIEFVDRYSATGTPRPDENSCGWCEGMGVSPTQTATLNAEAVGARNGRLIIIGQKNDDDTPCEEDGYVFVRCPECFGTRKKNATPEAKLEMLKKDFSL